MAKQIRINAFFKTRLGVKLSNPIWSWGAHDASARRVFLRVNEDFIVDDEQGDRWAIVYNPDWRPSPGHAERLKQLAVLRNHEATGYAVVVRFNASGKIKSFDDESLYVLGEIVKEDSLTYAKLIDQLSVEQVSLSSSDFGTTSSDIQSILASELPPTQRRALVDARIGQGAFREAVLRQWDYRCAVTGVAVSAAIRASHIKPWKDSSDSERLDPDNGLPLVATLDALFDVGFITFDSRGKMLLSSKLNEDDRRSLGIQTRRLRWIPAKQTIEYLDYHRRQRFLP